ncbi:MAG: isoprenylcysteine carboxylmethyltransferase family protein [Acidobacteria bacterium]|nr:isoprenylcysteine carboxylmethyltransferase family protein [Acidobacteriota bacterium]
MNERRYWFPKPYADTVARLRVPAGFILVAAFLYLASPGAGSLAIGVPVAFAGLALRGWAAGHLEKNRELATSGPYALVRNPLYLGTLIVAAGFVIAARRWELGVIFALVFGGVYLPVIELEEQHLRKLFPSYADYAGRVPTLWPRLGNSLGPKRFQARIYMINQEYQAALGFLAGLAVLLWKTVR